MNAKSTHTIYTILVILRDYTLLQFSTLTCLRRYYMNASIFGGQRTWEEIIRRRCSLVVIVAMPAAMPAEEMTQQSADSIPDRRHKLVHWPAAAAAPVKTTTTQLVLRLRGTAAVVCTVPVSVWSRSRWAVSVSVSVCRRLRCWVLRHGLLLWRLVRLAGIINVDHQLPNVYVLVHHPACQNYTT